MKKTAKVYTEIVPIMHKNIENPPPRFKEGDEVRVHHLGEFLFVDSIKSLIQSSAQNRYYILVNSPHPQSEIDLKHNSAKGNHDSII